MILSLFFHPSMSRLPSTILLVSLLGLLLTACTPDIVPGADVDVDADGSMKIETDEGTMDIGNSSLPADWPEDIGIYPGAKIAYSASVTTTPDKPGMAVVLQTSDSAADVNAYYKDQFESNGWEIVGSMNAGSSITMAAKKDGRVASVMIATADGQTTVTLGIAVE